MPQRLLRLAAARMLRWTLAGACSARRARRAVVAMTAATMLLGSQSWIARAEAPMVLDATQARVVELTNMERVKAGLSPLAVSASLTQAASVYSEAMATTECFGHACGPVEEIAARDEQAGYRAWIALGENLAAGYRSAEEVVAGWMGSPGHRANILNPAYTEIGVGVAPGRGRYRRYWTQEFGTRHPDLLAFQPLISSAPEAEPVPDAVPEESGG